MEAFSNKSFNDGHRTPEKQLRYQISKHGPAEKRNSTVENNLTDHIRAHYMPQNQNGVSNLQLPRVEKPESRCNSDTIMLCVIIAFGIVSTAFSAFVWHKVASVDTSNCGCSPTRGEIFESGFAPSEKAMPELLQEMKRKLKQGIHTLQEKMNNFSRIQNNEQFNVDKDKEKLIDGCPNEYKKTVENLERIYNEIERNTKREFEQINEKVEKLGEPDCLFKQAKETKNGTLVTVSVPKITQDRVTVGVTCSTTLQNTADVRYMVPPSEDGHGEEYTCYCSSTRSKQIDCVAYFWQCKLVS